MKWIDATKKMPTEQNSMGYLVMINDCKSPMIAQFDPTPKRFVVFIPTISKPIQVPVTHWCKIDPLP